MSQITKIALSSPLVHLRPTEVADLPFVMDAEQHSDNAPYVNQWTIEQHKDAIASTNDGHFIAQTNNASGTARIGYLILTGLTDPHQVVLLRRIVVTAKGQGYGRQILQWAKQFTFEHLGYHRLWLDVVVSNQRAQALYLSEGFVIQGTLREAYKNEQSFEDMLILSLLRPEYLRTQRS